MQMGHSSGGGGSLNSAASCNSAARFLHAFLCWGRCAIWQSRLQYFTNLHAVHDLRSSLFSSPFPQLAHILSDKEEGVDDIFFLYVYGVIFFDGRLMGCCWRRPVTFKTAATRLIIKRKLDLMSILAYAITTVNQWRPTVGLWYYNKLHVKLDEKINDWFQAGALVLV